MPQVSRRDADIVFDMAGLGGWDESVFFCYAVVIDFVGRNDGAGRVRQFGAARSRAPRRDQRQSGLRRERGRKLQRRG